MTEVKRDPLWPEHWDVAALGDITTRVTSGSRDWKPYYEQGTGVFILTQNVRMGQLDVSRPFHVGPPEDDPARARSAVQEGDLLVTIVGANVGNVARVPRPLPEHYVCQSLALVRPADMALSRFLEIFLMAPQGGQKYFESCNYGQGRPHLSFKDIKAMPVPLPPPDEQLRIVTAVDESFAAIDSGERSLRSAHDALAPYRRAVLQAALTGALTDAWTRTTVESVGRVQLGRQRAPKYHRGANMRPYLRVANVFEDRLDFGDVMEMDFPPDDFQRYELKAGDILLNEGQSPELLGRPAMYRGEAPGTCFTNSLIRFQPFDVLDGEFALLVFRHYMHSGRFQQESRLTVNIAHLSAARFATIDFPLPGLEEQRRIVSEVHAQMDAAGRFEATLADAVKDAGVLRSAVMRDALAGRLAAATTKADGEYLNHLYAAAREGVVATRARKTRRAVPAGSQS